MGLPSGPQHHPVPGYDRQAAERCIVKPLETRTSGLTNTDEVVWLPIPLTRALPPSSSAATVVDHRLCRTGFSCFRCIADKSPGGSLTG